MKYRRAVCVVPQHRRRSFDGALTTQMALNHRRAICGDIQLTNELTAKFVIMTQQWQQCQGFIASVSLTTHNSQTTFYTDFTTTIHCITELQSKTACTLTSVT